MIRHTAVDLGFKLLNAVHKSALRVSSGRWPRRLAGMPGVELHTVGRRSGLPRSTMLTAPIHDDHRVVLVASKGGDDRHPEWYRNLMARPDAEMTIDGQVLAVRARTASPEERAALWPLIVAAYRPYGTYQRRARREIPVVICERVEGGIGDRHGV